MLYSPNMREDKISGGNGEIELERIAENRIEENNSGDYDNSVLNDYVLMDINY